MASELRWILLGLAVPLLAAIWWWTARRAAQQAPGNAELRESTIPPEPRYNEPEEHEAVRVPVVEHRDWGVPPFEPLHIRTGGFDHVPILDGPMMVTVDPVPHSPLVSPPMHDFNAVDSEPFEEPSEEAFEDAPQATIAQPALPALRVPSGGSLGENTGRFNAAAAPAPNTAERQKIISIRVSTVNEQRWAGAQLMAVLELHGLAFGRYQVFHRKHADGRSLFCVANRSEPGTFNLAEMAGEEFRGIILFAVLPGPAEPLATVDELFETARELAEDLSGMVQDGKGMPMSPQRAAAIRAEVAQFQAALPGT